MELMFQPYKKYAQFSGRARRKEYWLFILLFSAISLIAQWWLGGIEGTGSASSTELLGALAFFSFAVASFIPCLAVGFRRLHDTNRSAWWFVLVLVPLLGQLILLVFMALPGTVGPNRFGPDPKVESGALDGSDGAAVVL
jgi:uncharacterized membrane protein YhaH (DUF805 family)